MENNEEYITIKDGLDVVEKRHLLEITNIMVNAINKKDFIKICKIYGDASERILKKGNKNGDV